MPALSVTCKQAAMLALSVRVNGRSCLPSRYPMKIAYATTSSKIARTPLTKRAVLCPEESAAFPIVDLGDQSPIDAR